MIRLSTGVALVEVERSGVVESVHTGSLVVLDPDGSIRVSLGNPEQPIFPRSCNKPMQAAALAELGLYLPSHQRALSTASHSGEQLHIDEVMTMLQAGGFAEADLGCPPDWPLDPTARDHVLAAGGTPRRILMNCSGKHAAMLLTCQHLGWPTADYLDLDHPLQQHILATVREISGDPVPAIGVDGCGAPVFALSLVSLARAFSRIATAPVGSPEHAVAFAMREHPELVAGPGRSATRLMQGVTGLIAKDGAEAIYAAALPDGTAIALKIDDGAVRALDRAVVLALRLAGVGAAVLDELETVPLLGGGVAVGSIRPVQL